MKNQPSIEACHNFRFRNTPETLRYFYHPDHIGSTSWVTDNAKNGIQYCEYLPFGEPFLDQRSTTWNSRYTFSGKERDNETGYSYFGARYYNSDISIWLSVDPMADKYPNQSNYVYCSNNPIKIIDPNGEDEWDLARDGTLTMRENGRTDIDIVHGKDKDGNDVSRNFKAGSINNNAKEYKGTFDDGTEYTTNYMEFSNEETATDFFEFAAEYSDVEWALKISYDQSYVGTSKEARFVGMPSPKGMTTEVHSHINDPNHIIGSDHWAAVEMAEKGINYKVYLQGKGVYATYNESKRGLFSYEPTRMVSNSIKQIKQMNKFLNLKW